MNIPSIQTIIMVKVTNLHLFKVCKGEIVIFFFCSVKKFYVKLLIFNQFVLEKYCNFKIY